jgi:hypothetical protein
MDPLLMAQLVDTQHSLSMSSNPKVTESALELVNELLNHVTKMVVQLTLQTASPGHPILCSHVQEALPTILPEECVSMLLSKQGTFLLMRVGPTLLVLNLFD